MKAWHNFWFWYHTSIGMNICMTASKYLHHMNRAEIHEYAAKKNMGVDGE